MFELLPNCMLFILNSPSDRIPRPREVKKTSPRSITLLLTAPNLLDSKSNGFPGTMMLVDLKK
uniref:OK/SW-CL.89 n=1 Tax=Homo sapiens TaxID=9606 RepID=Q8NI78_HUMAN|nr:OK/SW-CL.89 [Homo sapiens]